MVATKASLARRLAAEVLGVGESRIWIDPENLDRVAAIISREEVRKLIKEGVIKVRPPSTPSRGRVRIRRKQKKKGRRKGSGSRKGSRADEKDLWVAKIRALRKYLKYLKRRKLIDRRTYRRLYLMTKGGSFKSVRHLKTYLIEHNLMRRY